MKLINGKDGKLCTAKLAYVITLGVILFKVIAGGETYFGHDFAQPQISELSMLLGVVGATYFGRSHTKRG